MSSLNIFFTDLIWKERLDFFHFLIPESQSQRPSFLQFFWLKFAITTIWLQSCCSFYQNAVFPFRINTVSLTNISRFSSFTRLPLEFVFQNSQITLTKYVTAVFLFKNILKSIKICVILYYFPSHLIYCFFTMGKYIHKSRCC